jgi:hypothetical protein
VGDPTISGSSSNRRRWRDRRRQKKDKLWRERAWTVPNWDSIPDNVQRDWKHHIDRERITRRATKTFETAVIIISASITVMASFNAPPQVLGIAGALVTILTAISTRYQYRESWIRHNRVLLAIQTEIVKYSYRLDPYKGDDQTGRLAFEVEQIVATDATIWAERELQKVRSSK